MPGKPDTENRKQVQDVVEDSSGSPITVRNMTAVIGVQVTGLAIVIGLLVGYQDRMLTVMQENWERRFEDHTQSVHGGAMSIPRFQELRREIEKRDKLRDDLQKAQFDRLNKKLDDLIDDIGKLGPAKAPDQLTVLEDLKR